MNQVRFEENNEFHIKSRRLFGEPETPSMVRLLLRSGLAKNEKQALYILIGLVVVTLVMTIFLIRVQIMGPTGTDYIVAPDGTEYTFEEYIELVNQGNDPLTSRDNAE